MGSDMRHYLVPWVCCLLPLLQASHRWGARTLWRHDKQTAVLKLELVE
jgi:hypothetical protein